MVDIVCAVVGRVRHGGNDGVGDGDGGIDDGFFGRRK